MKRLLRNILIAVIVFLIGARAVQMVRLREAADESYAGAYRDSNGLMVFVTLDDNEHLRFRTIAGETGRLWRTARAIYQGGEGWDQRQPVVNRFQFRADADQKVVGATWTHRGVTHQLERLALTEHEVRFSSAGVELYGKLIVPSGQRALPTVVLAHGAEAAGAVHRYYEPYLYAAHGFAAFVFDKRGTGRSGGRYLQNVAVLADDVVAAVRSIAQHDSVDPSRIHLAGFSQGGWVAPLAALKHGSIRSLLIGYGPAVSIACEERWGYVYLLRRRGFNEADIAAADRVNEIVEQVLRGRTDRLDDLRAALESLRAELLETLKRSDSMLGYFAAAEQPVWWLRLRLWWLQRQDPPYVDRSYAPGPTLSKLQVPSLWIFAGEDSSAPSQWSVVALDALVRDHHPIEYHVIPGAEHGMLLFTQDEEGQRRLQGYDPKFFQLQIEWLRRHSVSTP